MPIVLSRGRRLLSDYLVARFFLDVGRFAARLYNCNGSFGLILPRCRVTVCLPDVLATKGHALGVSAKLSKVAIVLAWGWSLLSGNLITRLLFDVGVLASRLRLADSTLRLVLARSRVRVWLPDVLASESHVLIVGPKLCKMAIVLTGCRCLLTGNHIA